MLELSIASIVARMISGATPIVIAGAGGILCERSGVTNVGIEGMMLGGAFAATLGAYYTGNAWLGLLFGVVVAMAMALLHAWLCVTVRINHVISGLAINIFAGSMTVYLMGVIFGATGNTPPAPVIPDLSIPGAAGIPVIGEFLSGFSPITLLGVGMIAVIAVVLRRSAFGLHVLASGENPVAAATVGINVRRVQYLSVLVSGLCSGVAGAFLTVSFMNSFVKNMVAGRGFIAIATILFGRYNPVLVALAGLFFGFLDAMQMALQGTVDVPQELIQCVPYLLTIVAVVVSGEIDRKKGKVKANG